MGYHLSSRGLLSRNASPERNNFEEGFVYRDDVAKKWGFFSIHSSAVFTAGVVTVNTKVITFEGQMTWPAPPPNPEVKQRYDFRNTLELRSASEMADRWFQDAFGSWSPSHVITFKAAKSNRGPARPD